MITLDFETRSDADLKRWGATRYALDDTTDVLCMAWAYDDEEKVHLWHRSHDWVEESPFPEELCDRIASGEIVEAHNAGFEFAIFNYTLRKRFPDFRKFKLKLEQLRCSAAKGSCLSLPRGLGEAADALGIGERKLADGRRLINKLSKPMPRRVGSKDGPYKTLAGARLLAHFLRLSERCKGTPRFDPSREFTLQGTNGAYSIAGVGWAKELGAKTPENSVRDKLERDFRDMRRYCYDRGDKSGRWYRSDVPITAKDRALVEQWADYTPEQNISEVPAEPEFCEEEPEHRANWAYCQQDVRTERAYSKDIPEMSEKELEFWRMDFRMNQRGILLDAEGAKIALDLADKETQRLNSELQEITEGAILKGSQRGQLLKWMNGKLVELQAEPLPNTKADTLSFSLHGVPTKAGDEAKEAAKPASDAKWESIGPDGAIVRRAMEICMEVNKTSVAKFKQMVDSVTPHDGRLHDIMLFNGADRTGRWSGKGVQPHNFVRGYMENMCDVWDDIKTLDLDYITLIYGEPLVCLAKACRGALIASPGKEIYAADFNAIEARKLAWLSGCTRLLTLFQERGDPYIDMASAIYKRPITKADKTERQLGKKAILGLGYAMGWEKFQATVWADEGIWLPDEMCQEIVRLYRKEMYPEIPKLWKDAGNAAILAVQKGGEHFCGGDEEGTGRVSYFMSDDRRFLHCKLPSGRLLAYYQPKVSVRVTYRFAAINEHGNPTTVNFPAKKSVPQHRVRWHAEKLAEKAHKRLLSDPPESFLSPHLSFMGRDIFTKKWKRVGTHGGTLVENFDQASSRDLLAEAMYRIDQRPPFELLLSIHDEVIAEAPKGTCTLKEFESLMAEVPEWAPKMPITAEGWIGQRLRK